MASETSALPIDVAALTTLVQQLTTRVTDLESLNPTEATSISRSPINNIKTTLPDTFHGARSKLRSFVSQLSIYFALQHNKFDSDIKKIMFAASLLRDTAFDWFEPNLRKKDSANPPKVFTTYVNFISSLESTFGDIDAKATAERQLKALYQIASAAAYSTSFQQIASFLDWDDAALCFAFYDHLKDDVKDDLAKDDRPSTLQALIAKAIKIDNRQFERKREKTASHSRSSTTTTMVSQQNFTPSRFVQRPASSTVNQSNSNTLATRVPSMEIQQRTAPVVPPSTNFTTPRQLRSSGKLPDSERARRIQLNLCLYCGNAKHSVANCPVLKERDSTIAATYSNKSQHQLEENFSTSIDTSFDFANESSLRQENS
jgi:Ty3 transposon capsid-like protein